MEFVGKIVTKEFKGFGIFEGVVESYDSSTGFFKILYEDGDFEEADFSEVSGLVSSAPSSAVAHSISENHKVGTAKKVGRKPKRRRRNDPGKLSEVLEANDSSHNLVIKHGISNNAMIDINDSVNVNGNLDVIIDNGVNDGFDLNRGLIMDDELGNVELRGSIDLNLSVADDGFYENDTRVEKNDSLGKKEHGFDLNLGLNDDSVNGEIGNVDANACVVLGEELKNGDASVAYVDHVTDGVYVQLEGGVSGVVTPNLCVDGNSGRRKKRKVERNLSSPTETVLRRSARRAKAAALLENNVSGATAEEDVNDLPVSGVIDEPDEKPVPQVLERLEEPQAHPSNIEFPPSSVNLNLEGIPVLDLFSVYSCLRSFSTILYLSPFELEDLVAALKSRVSNQLIDSIHVSILQTLKKHLELLSTEGCESASSCLRNLNWDLLDVITWPIFMVEYLLIHGSGFKPGFTLNCLKLFDGEYYKQSAEVKIELLRCLCDDVVEVEVIRSELSKRTIIAEANMEKRKISVEALGDSCLNEDMKEEVADGNSDECCLCKMDGNLICCDGCPAAYHSKCVGIVSSVLPEGDWYCPECVIGRQKCSNKSQKFFRGAELLGIDPVGRLFFSCFDYLLVSDSHDAEALCSYYHKNDLGVVIQLLQSSSAIYSSILSAIYVHWAFPADSYQQRSNLRTENYTEKPMETRNQRAISERSGEVLPENGLIQKSRRGRKPASNTAARVNFGRNFPAPKQQKKKGSSSRESRSLKAKEEDILHRLPGDGYMNSYDFARTAASVVEELLRKPTGKVNIGAPKTEEELISVQLKFILQKSVKSCWTTIQDLDGGRQKEKCGWCYCCRFPVEGRGCLFSVKNNSSVPVARKIEIDSVLSKRNKKGHLVDVICYILNMEERLRGFLSGPWLRPQYTEHWRQRVLKASDVLSLKVPLLLLESHLRPLAVSEDWWKHVDLVPTMGSASHFVASSRATSKNGIYKKKVRCAESETKSSTTRGGLLLYWWRGGKTSRSLFNWKVVPRSLALKVARKAGGTKIPDIQYPDASENAKRTNCVAWRAAVETCTSLEQLALQVREFDLFIRWDDIENTHPHPLLDKESIKSIRLFKKVIIRRKCLEGTVARYLLDFGKRRSIPDVVIKHGKKLEESDCERKKYWLDEMHVPLYLLKSFEERRIMRKATKKISSKSQKFGKVAKKPSRENGFEYLFSRAERADSYQCGHCNKNVPIGEAVSCQLCNGNFHKRHVMKFSEGITSGCTYTCHRCRVGKHVKKERNLRKRKFGDLRETKILKVDCERPSATLRAKPKKKSKALVNHRQVLSRSAKKMQCQKYTNNVYTGITLRRSARKAKCVSLHSNKAPGGKKRKRNKPRNVASKKPLKGFLWQKKRTQTLSSFWINGLFLSKKPIDERVVQFKRRKVLVPSGISADDQRKCSLCSQQGSTSAAVFISCEICEDWFHGAAFGLNDGNIESLVGFKCHVCRDRSTPVCPFVDISMDNSTLFSEIISETQQLPEVAVRMGGHCVPELQHNEGSCGQNCDGNLDQQGSPTSKELQCEKDSASEAWDVQGSHEAVAIRKDIYSDCVKELLYNGVSSGLLEVDTTQKCERNLEALMLDAELSVQNRSSPSKELQCNEGLTCEVQDAQELPEVAGRKETEYGLEFQRNKGSYSLIEVHTSQNCEENLDRDETPMVNSELIEESTSSTHKWLQCNRNSTSDAQELPEVVSVRKETEYGPEFQCNKGSSSIIEVHTSQNRDENLDRDETPMVNSELMEESTSSTYKWLQCNKNSTSDSLGLPEVAIAKETDCVKEIQCDGVSSSLLAVHAAKNCDENVHQVESQMLDVEYVLPSSKEPQLHFGSCLLEFQTAENCDRNFDQDETRVLENGSSTSKVVISCSIENQDLDLEANLPKESDENSIMEGNQIS